MEDNSDKANDKNEANKEVGTKNKANKVAISKEEIVEKHSATEKEVAEISIRLNQNEEY